MLLTFPSFASPLLQFSSLHRHLFYLSFSPSLLTLSHHHPFHRPLGVLGVFLADSLELNPATHERTTAFCCCWGKCLFIAVAPTCAHGRLLLLLLLLTTLCLPCMWLLSLWRSLVALVVRWSCPSLWLFILCASCAGELAERRRGQVWFLVLELAGDPGE